MAYVTLLRLVSDASLLAAIRNELNDTKFQYVTASHRAKLVPSGLPRLHALFREVMRYHTTAWSAREVTENVTLELKNNDDSINPRIYELEKGGIVAMPSSLLHYDPAVHRDPKLFDSKRFLSKNLGGRGTPVTSATLRPFGGGISYCPGRLFAEKQVVGYLATLCARLDFETFKKELQIPRNSDFFFVTKCPQIELRVSKRTYGKDN
jgi:cytochrome P450